MVQIQRPLLLFLWQAGLIGIIQIGYSLADSFTQVLYGEVGAGNYTYYSLSKSGRVHLVLHSLTGDADLYVSSRTKKPTYFLEEHEFQSTSCGTDQVHVSPISPRPLGIGVYGHPSNNASEYALQVFLDDTSSLNRDDSQYPDQHSADHEKLKSEKPESGAMEFLEIIGSILSFILQVLLEVLS